MSKSKLGIIGLIFLILSSLALYYFLDKNNSDNSQVETINIGVILPETHKDYASYAKQLKKGMNLAEVLYNKKNDNRDSLNLIFEDGVGTAQKTISAFNKLTDFNKVSMVIGPMFSNTAEALAPLASQKKVILLSPSASSIALSNAGRYFFRIYPSDNYDGEFLATFINKNFNNQKVAIINEKASSIDQVIDVFKNNLENKPIFENSVAGNSIATSIAIELNKIKSLQPEIVFFPGNKNFMVTVLKKAKEIGLNCKFITISTFNDEELLNTTKDSSEGILFSSPAFDITNNTPEMIDFRNEFLKMYNEEPDILAGYGFDVVNIALEGMQNSQDTDSIIDNLLSIKNYPGVTGKTSFNKNGDVIKSLEVLTVKDNKFVKYE